MGWVDAMKKLVMLFLVLAVFVMTAGGCPGYQEGQPCPHDGDVVGSKGVTLTCRNGTWRK